MTTARCYAYVCSLQIQNLTGITIGQIWNCNRLGYDQTALLKKIRFHQI